MVYHIDGDIQILGELLGSYDFELWMIYISNYHKPQFTKLLNGNQKNKAGNEWRRRHVSEDMSRIKWNGWHDW